MRACTRCIRARTLRLQTAFLELNMAETPVFSAQAATELIVILSPMTSPAHLHPLRGCAQRLGQERFVVSPPKSGSPKSRSGLEFILSQIFFFVIWAVPLMLAKKRRGNRGQILINPQTSQIAAFFI